MVAALPEQSGGKDGVVTEKGEDEDEEPDPEGGETPDRFKGRWSSEIQESQQITLGTAAGAQDMLYGALLRHIQSHRESPPPPIPINGALHEVLDKKLYIVSIVRTSS